MHLYNMARLILMTQLIFLCFKEFQGSDSVSKLSESDDGGWFTDEKTMVAQAGPCMIDVRDKSLTQEEFLERYAYQVPVILKDFTDNKKFTDLCRKDTILDKHGDKVIRLSSANSYSYSKADVSLRTYVEKMMKPQTLDALGNETWYWFGDNNHDEWEDFFSTYVPPSLNLPGHTGAYSFGVAGAGTGVPFHFHGPVFAEVIFGRKRWFFHPPEKTPHFHPNQTTLQWLVKDFPELHPADVPMECTIGPGEIIYFPDRWWHGTLNIDTTVFISTFLAR